MYFKPVYFKPVYFKPVYFKSIHGKGFALPQSHGHGEGILDL